MRLVQEGQGGVGSLRPVCVMPAGRGLYELMGHEASVCICVLSLCLRWLLPRRYLRLRPSDPRAWSNRAENCIKVGVGCLLPACSYTQSKDNQLGLS